MELLSFLLCYCWHFVKDEVWNRLLVVFVGIGMELLLAGQKYVCIGMELLLAGQKYLKCTILRIRDYKNAAQHFETLGAAMKADMQQMQHVQERTKKLNDKRIPTPFSMMIRSVIEAEDEEHLQWS
ncbi:hypothetical protein Vadar_028449 [Vaccinium darrowii]|uniref:Uncharacterized protein n=1 Tax=Vaccinium darrowii TaxID=229202 RepID=A0ACB7XTT4_9ERIC|nr:hypothetical protein Vadar_028449 [Vaccinium darrowii]